MAVNGVPGENRKRVRREAPSGPGVYGMVDSEGELIYIGQSGDLWLGGSALLGMSVLSRYRMTIDDEANSLTLAPK